MARTPTPKPKPVPAPAQQFPVGIAAPESIKGAAPSVTDIGREMAFKSSPIARTVEWMLC